MTDDDTPRLEVDSDSLGRLIRWLTYDGALDIRLARDPEPPADDTPRWHAPDEPPTWHVEVVGPDGVKHVIRTQEDWLTALAGRYRPTLIELTNAASLPDDGPDDK